MTSHPPGYTTAPPMPIPPPRLKPRVLAICQWGHSRSAALVRVLHGQQYLAVSIGVSSDLDGSLVCALGEWADKICVMEPHFASHIPPHLHPKILHFDVGPDRWSNPYNQELLTLLGGMVKHAQEGGAL